MKALVTGVAGFVGSNLAEALINQGHDVVGIDSLTEYYSQDIKMNNLKLLNENPRFKFCQTDLVSADLSVDLEDISYVFHQAGQPGVRKSWGADFTDYVDWNVLGTQRLLEACKDAPSLQRFVYASSSSVYGNAIAYPTSENDLPAPISPYGVSKLAAEHLTSLYAENYNVPTVSLRYFTVYGPRQRPDMAFTRFVTAAQTDQEITIFGNGQQIRDFTYISDVVEANIAAATQSIPNYGAIYNVAGGSSVTVNEVLQKVEAIHGKPLNVTYVDKSLGDANRTGGDTSKIESDLGWAPKLTVDDGLQHQYQWASENLCFLEKAIAE